MKGILLIFVGVIVVWLTVAVVFNGVGFEPIETQSANVKSGVPDSFLNLGQ